MKNNLVMKNILVSGITRLIIMVLGIVMPRLLITSFGSDINGLLSTVTQIFTYLALLEAGIGTSTINALYMPLSKKNGTQINEVVTEARQYYRKVSLVYGGCILAFSAIYPFLTNGDIDRFLVFEIIILQGASSFLYYYMCAVYEQLLVADGRKYVLENIHFFSYVLQTLGKIVLIRLGFDVIVVQIVALVSTIVRIFILKAYARKKYPQLNFKTKPTQHYLHERKAFVIHEFSSVIFHNTAVVLVASFCGFALASVYTVYNTIYSSLNNLLTTVNSGLGFVLGQNLDKDRKELCRIYDVYNSLYIAASFVLFTLAAILTKPFLTLYTAGVTDANYLLPGLTLLFVLHNLLSGVRAIGSRLITVSGHADKTKLRSIMETVINLVASIVLVAFLDVYGVLLGGIVAMLYRSNDIIIYANLKILGRSPLRDYALILVNALVAAGIYGIFTLWNPTVSGYLPLLGYAAVFGVICLFVFLAIAILTNLAAYRPYLQVFKSKIFKTQ